MNCDLKRAFAQVSPTNDSARTWRMIALALREATKEEPAPPAAAPVAEGAEQSKELTFTHWLRGHRGISANQATPQDWVELGQDYADYLADSRTAVLRGE